MPSPQVRLLEINRRNLTKALGLHRRIILVFTNKLETHKVKMVVAFLFECEKGALNRFLKYQETAI
jgi:hypothetical protein